MKQLLIVRHAKSSWDIPLMADHDRPLNKRGLRDAPDMGKRLADRGFMPQLFYTSTALRADHTTRLITFELGIDQSFIVHSPSLYHASVSTLIEFVKNIDDQNTRICLAGHNPGLTDLVNILANQKIVNIPTCGMVLLNLNEESWMKAGIGKFSLTWFDYPKNKPHQAN